MWLRETKARRRKPTRQAKKIIDTESLWIDRRHPWLNYVGGMLFWGLAMLPSFWQNGQASDLSISGLLLLAAITFTAMLWGIGPTMFITIISIFSLNKLYPPMERGMSVVYDWNLITPLFLFTLSAIGIAVLVSQREKAQKQVLMQEEEKKTQQILGASKSIHGQINQKKRPENLLPTVLEMTEALLRLPQKSGQQEESIQPRAGSDIVEQQLLKLACCLLECSSASVIAVDSLTEQLSLVASANYSLEQEQIWREELKEGHLRDYLSPVQITRLQAGEVLHPQQEKEQILFLGRDYETLIAPVQRAGELQGLFVLAYKQERRHLAQEHRHQIKALAQTLARMLEREKRLYEHIETQAGELVLRHALHRMDESISMVSHELKTPLTAIHVNAQLAQYRVKRLNTQEVQSPDYLHTMNDLQDLLGRIENQVRIQNRLIDDLLDVPRTQTNCLKMESERFNLVELVKEVTVEQSQSATTRTIVSILPQEEEVMVTADRDRIRQVINNYMTNAIKYSPANQPIALILDVAEETIRISVSDHGPGLTESEQERIWQRFYQAPGIKVQVGSSKGLGLGLHICRTIVEQHHGEIGVSSLPGNGSTFWFTLPISH